MKDFFLTHKNKFLLGLIFLLFAGFCFLLLYRLGVHAFIDWDESIYAQVAKEMLQNNRWFDLTYFGQAWYEKPPLNFWLMSIAYAIGGINEWVARMPTALASIGMVALSLRWVYEARKSYLAVLFTISAYFIMYPFLVNSYFVTIDTIVAFAVMIALYSWWKIFIAESISEKNKKIWYIVFGMLIGLGVLTKNIVGFFPLIPIAFYSLIQWDFKFLRDRHFWYGVLVAVVIILPWHIYQSLRVGQPFWDNYFIYHVFRRSSTNLEYNGAPFLFFVEMIFLRYREATVIFGGSMIVSLFLAWKNKHIKFFLISALTLLLVFSIPITKLSSYITMVLPFIVMLSGIVLAQVIKWIPYTWLKGMVVVVLIPILVYTGFQFNQYKFVKGESNLEYATNKKTGLFLKDFRRDLPVYINAPYFNLAIGFYGERSVQSITDQSLGDKATKKVHHTASQSVYIGDEYIIIVRQ